MGFTSPTPVQEKVIPLMLDGFDCLVQAPTGTGKTCAFGVPTIDGAQENEPLVQTLILCPTRELAMQIERELKRIAAVTAIKITALFGGQSVEKQMADLRKKPQIVVGTPGRVIDHIRRKTLKLHGIKTLVLDEADEMLDMGFLPDIKLIVKAMPKIRQTALFSATLSDEIKKISAEFQNDPVFVKTTVGDLDVPDIKQYYIKLKEENKYEALKRILKDKDFKLSLVFCNTKSRVDALYERLDKDGYLCDKIHGDLKQRLRDKTMRAYRDKKLNVLVATDVAARGIDVDCVEAVFNYDLPLDEEFYVHRIGRTARANRTGEAFSFATKRDIYRLNLYEKLTNTPIEEMSIDSLSENFAVKEKKNSDTPQKKKIFCGIGSMDGFSEGDFKKLLSQKFSIPVFEICNVKMAEVYSFFEVSEENASKVQAVGGIKLNGRFVHFEQAKDRASEGAELSAKNKNSKPSVKKAKNATSHKRQSATGNKKKQVKGGQDSLKPLFDGKGRSSRGDAKKGAMPKVPDKAKNLRSADVKGGGARHSDTPATASDNYETRGRKIYFEKSDAAHFTSKSSGYPKSGRSATPKSGKKTKSSAVKKAPSKGKTKGKGKKK